MKLVKTSWILGLAAVALVSGVASANFKIAKGTVLIAAPTALNGPSLQGVWFFNPSTQSFSLELQNLATNQVYEGWIIDEQTGKKFSTGLFRASGSIDSDSAGRYAGPLALNFPPAPGSDFVTLGHNLADGYHSVVITVEPYPDSDPNPSGFAILKVKIPAGISVGSELTLESIAH